MIKGNKLKNYMICFTAAVICLAVLAIAFIMYKCYIYNHSGVPDAISSFSSGTECSLIVTANTSRIKDKKAFAEKIFQMCRANSFHTIKLSTDVSGWPSSLDIKVYLHRADIGKKEPEMRIRFVPPDDGYEHNIRDDGDKYGMIVE